MYTAHTYFICTVHAAKIYTHSTCNDVHTIIMQAIILVHVVYAHEHVLHAQSEQDVHHENFFKCYYTTPTSSLIGQQL